MIKQFGFWLRTAALFLLRSGRSTAALSIMVVAAVAALIFLSSLAVGINDAMVRNSVRLYGGHISGCGLPASLSPDKLSAPGVQGVVKRVPVAGILEGGGRYATVALMGVDPAAERRFAAYWKKTVQGAFPEPGSPGVFISGDLADELGVSAGDTIRFSPGDLGHFKPFPVAGVYLTGIEQLDRGIAFCSLSAHPAPGGPWCASVFLADGVDPEEVLRQYRRDLPEAAPLKTWSDLMPDLRQLIDLNYVSMSMVTVLVFGVVSLGIACAFVIFIMKHLREYGIMKAMGVTAGQLAGLIFSEIMLMNLAASAAGIAAGIAAVLLVRSSGIDLTAFTSHNRYFSVSGIIYPRLTAFSLWSPPALALAFSMAAAVWPALLVGRKRAADILKVG